MRFSLNPFIYKGFDVVFNEFLKIYQVELLGRAFKEIEKLFLKVF